MFLRRRVPLVGMATAIRDRQSLVVLNFEVFRQVVVELQAWIQATDRELCFPFLREEESFRQLEFP